MKHRLLKYLVCPECNSDLECKNIYEEGGEIVKGKLICKECDKDLKIMNGIPRLVSDSYSPNQKIAKAFGYELENFPILYKEYEKQFLDWIHPIKPEFFLKIK